MSTPPVDLPLDDKSNAIKFSYPFVVFFSTVFVVLRLWNGIRTKKKWYLNASDWLLAVAHVCALTGTGFGYMTGFVGAGKHAWDPSVTKEHLAKYLMYLWFGQYFNLTAMALLKFSICALMLQLNFSRTFRILIWISVVIHIGLNVIFPYIILFGECAPVAKHWNSRLPGSCWSAKPRVISGYLGASSNIVSDILYTCAPLIYTRKVQLPRRAMWGVRVVFLLGFVATIISAVKLYEIKALSESKDVAYESVNLSILSVSEVLVGNLTASLPPLRRLFENLLNRIFPESFMSTRHRSNMNSYVLPDLSSHTNTRRPKHEDPERDDNSEKTILPDHLGSSVYTVQGKHGNIVRTTHVSLTVDNTKQDSKSRIEEWS